MTVEQRQEIKDCIAFYEKRGSDWSTVVEYLIRRNHGTLPWQEQAALRQRLWNRRTRTKEHAK